MSGITSDSRASDSLSAPATNLKKFEHSIPENSPVPEHILADWRVAYELRNKGLLNEYTGQHVAIWGGKVQGSHRDSVYLRDEVAKQCNLPDDADIVIVYID